MYVQGANWSCSFPVQAVMLVDHMVFTNSAERVLQSRMEGNHDALRSFAELTVVRLETLNQQVIVASTDLKDATASDSTQVGNLSVCCIFLFWKTNIFTRIDNIF